MFAKTRKIIRRFDEENPLVTTISERKCEGSQGKKTNKPFHACETMKICPREKENPTIGDIHKTKKTKE